MFGRGAEAGAVRGRASRIEVQIVFVGHADPAVDLDAVLYQLAAVLPM